MSVQNKLFFTPGPAGLFPTVQGHYEQAFRENIGSISHRSSTFRKIYQHADEQLRTLFNLPKETGVLFTGSATEVWERVIMNTVEHESFHLVNGSFSKKFFEFSQQLHKYAHSFQKPFGEGFDANEVNVPEYAELICCTTNETSSGVQMRVQEIHKLKKSNKDKFMVVDMVSSAPYTNLDFNLVDSAFFSVQKAFGMPAGLGVWFANEAMVEKAKRIQQHEGIIGTYHSLPSLWENYKKFETPETPNVLSIYVLGKVAEDFNRIGAETIRKETEKKAKALYDFAQKSNQFDIFVENETHRSQTVVVLNCKENSSKVIQALEDQTGMVVGAGYGKLKESQIRIANFPNVNLEQVQELIENLKKLF
ncbi:MAG: Phosphoserine transaminase [Bacteroidota bacterium]|jgi:phosphoserine aminotransferase